MRGWPAILPLLGLSCATASAEISGTDSWCFAERHAGISEQVRDFTVSPVAKQRMVEAVQLLRDRTVVELNRDNGAACRCQKRSFRSCV